MRGVLRWRGYRCVRCVFFSFLFPFSFLISSGQCRVQLAIIFLHASSRTERVWYLIGSSLRAVQELGYHRQPPSSPPSSPSSSAADQQSRDNQERKDRTRRGVPTMESELKKRVFYTLLLAEAFVTATLGRPRSMNTSECV